MSEKSGEYLPVLATPATDSKGDQTEVVATLEDETKRVIKELARSSVQQAVETALKLLTSEKRSDAHRFQIATSCVDELKNLMNRLQEKGLYPDEPVERDTVVRLVAQKIQNEPATAQKYEGLFVTPVDTELIDTEVDAIKKITDYFDGSKPNHINENHWKQLQAAVAKNFVSTHDTAKPVDTEVKVNLEKNLADFISQDSDELSADKREYFTTTLKEIYTQINEKSGRWLTIVPQREGNQFVDDSNKILIKIKAPRQKLAHLDPDAVQTSITPEIALATDNEVKAKLNADISDSVITKMQQLPANEQVVVIAQADGSLISYLDAEMYAQIVDLLMTINIDTSNKIDQASIDAKLSATHIRSKDKLPQPVAVSAEGSSGTADQQIATAPAEILSEPVADGEKDKAALEMGDLLSNTIKRINSQDLPYKNAKRIIGKILQKAKDDDLKSMIIDGEKFALTAVMDYIDVATQVTENELDSKKEYIEENWPKIFKILLRARIVANESSKPATVSKEPANQRNSQQVPVAVDPDRVNKSVQEGMQANIDRDKKNLVESMNRFNLALTPADKIKELNAVALGMEGFKTWRKLLSNSDNLIYSADYSILKNIAQGLEANFDPRTKQFKPMSEEQKKTLLDLADFIQIDSVFQNNVKQLINEIPEKKSFFNNLFGR